MEDAGQLAYLRASVWECGFDKKMHANPSRCGILNRSAEFVLIGTLQSLNQSHQNPESTPYAIVIDQNEVRRFKVQMKCFYFYC